MLNYRIRMDDVEAIIIKVWQRTAVSWQELNIVKGAIATLYIDHCYLHPPKIKLCSK